MTGTANSKLKANILRALAAAFLLLFLWSLLDYYSNQLTLLALLLFLIFSYISTRILVKAEPDRAPRRMRGLMLFYCLLHLLIFFWLTVFGRAPIFIGTANQNLVRNTFRTRINLVPFKTIREMFGIVDSYGLAFVVKNLLGNVVCIAPTALFYPLLIKPARRPIVYFLLESLTCLAAEGLQLVFLTGACDIDDYILNVGGAMVFYLLFRLRPVRRLLDQLFPYAGFAD